MKISKYKEEHYVCWECKKRLMLKEMEVKLKCPDCDKSLLVYVKDGMQNKVIIRKNKDDILKGDIVDLPRTNFEFHEVLNIKKTSMFYEIALKNHGILKLGEDEWLNCINGTWNGDVSKLFDHIAY